MNYKDYAKRSREGQSWARDGAAIPDLDPVKRSEFFILRGQPDSARVVIDSVYDADAEAGYLQAARASRHFEDPTFLEGREFPIASASSWVLPMLRAACSVASRDGDGERLEHYISTSPGVVGAGAIRALAIVSNAYRNAGNLTASRRVLLEAFQLAPRGGVERATKPKPKIDLSFAQRRQWAFHDLLRTVNFSQHSLFPCSGTLLGLYRDNDFIPSDGDVDLGCLDPAGFVALKEALRKSGCFLLSPGRLDTNFNAKHVNGAKIDVSLYIPRGDGWAKTSHVYEWRFGKFSLGELATDYGRLPVPDQVEEYLSSMYEDWWVPRSGYDSRIDSPNLTYISRDEVIIVMASHILASYLQEGSEACVRWKQKFERFPDDMRAGITPFLAYLP